MFVIYLSCFGSLLSVYDWDLKKGIDLASKPIRREPRHDASASTIISFTTSSFLQFSKVHHTSCTSQQSELSIRQLHVIEWMHAADKRKNKDSQTCKAELRSLTITCIQSSTFYFLNSSPFPLNRALLICNGHFISSKPMLFLGSSYPNLDLYSKHPCFHQSTHLPKI